MSAESDDPLADGPAVPERGVHFVQSLERGLAVLRAFSAEDPELTLSDVARRTGLTRAAARRFLLTLVDLGYVAVDGRSFSLRPRVLELGYAYLSGITLSEVAVPHLERLSEAVQESSSVAVLDGEDVVYVARVPTKRIMTVAINVGTRFPAYATSLGQVLLSGLSPEELDGYLDRVQLRPLTRRTATDVSALRSKVRRARVQGWCLVDQELEEGLTSVAAPLREPGGRVVAAVNVSTHSNRRPSSSLERELVEPLLAAARGIEAELRVSGTRWHEQERRTGLPAYGSRGPSTS